MTPSPELKAAVLGAVAKEAAPTRRDVLRRRALVQVGAGAWVLLVFVGLGGMRAVERPLGFVIATAAGWAVVALGASLGAARGRSMLGRPREVLLGIVGVTPLALVAWYVAWLARAELVVAPSPLGASVRCVLATSALVLAPLVVAFSSQRGTEAVHPRASGAALGAVCGAWGAFLIDLHCERADLGHVTLGHALPVLLLAAAGALAGGRWLRVRDERA